MKHKKNKTKLRLKPQAKRILIILVLLIVGSVFLYNKYQDYLYTKTSDYAILNLGYTEEDLKVFNSKLSEDEKWSIVNDIGKNEFLINFIKCKYYLFKNTKNYLSLTVKKEEDFWHYKDPSYYDYDKLVASVNARTYSDYYTDTIKTDMSKGYSILVNKYHYLDDNYTPEDLVDVPWKYRFGGANDKITIRSEVMDSFLEMWNAAYEEGYYLLVDSGFRGYDEQKSVYDDYSKRFGLSYADSIAARPGYSEHQTGLALDIYSKQNASAKTFATTDVYKWLINNCYKYGFILRYPEGKSSLTGYSFESWHYRYVGKDEAKKIVDSGLTFDEYYEFYLDK